MRNSAKEGQDGRTDRSSDRLRTVFLAYLRQMIASFFESVARRRQEAGDRGGLETDTEGDATDGSAALKPRQTTAIRRIATFKDTDRRNGPATLEPPTVRAEEDDECLRLYDPDNSDSYISSDTYESVEQ